MKNIPAACALLILMTGCDLFPDPEEGMTSKPVLAKELAREPVRTLLGDIGAVTARLRCDEEQKKISGTFEFSRMDGRAPAFVVGDTACEEPGNLLLWYEHDAVVARENYTAELVDTELRALIARSNVKPAVHNRDNQVAAKSIEESYLAVSRERRLKDVSFICEKPGAPYKYVATVGNAKVITGRLTARCDAPHRNFSVAWRGFGPVDRGEVAAGPQFRVQDYNSVPNSIIVQSFGEFIGNGAPVSNL